MNHTGSGPLSAALRSADAKLGAAESPHMLGETGYVETPLLGKNYTVWRLPARLKGDLPHHQMRGTRLGPKRDGHLTARLQSPPPALRMASLPEVPAMLERPGQVGRIPTMNAEACLGF